jgi:hypothetical protein
VTNRALGLLWVYTHPYWLKVPADSMKLINDNYLSDCGAMLRKKAREQLDHRVGRDGLRLL